MNENIFDKIIGIVEKLNTPCCICDGTDCPTCGTLARMERKVDAIRRLREYKAIIEIYEKGRRQDGNDKL